MPPSEAHTEARIHHQLKQPVVDNRSPIQQTTVNPKLIEPLFEPLDEYSQPTPMPDEAELAHIAGREAERIEAEVRIIAGHKRLALNVFAASTSKQEVKFFGPKLRGADAKISATIG